MPKTPSNPPRLRGARWGPGHTLNAAPPPPSGASEQHKEARAVLPSNIHSLTGLT